MSDKKKMGDGGVDLKDKEKIRVQKPKKYKVIFHNDDFWVNKIISNLIRKCVILFK